MWKIKSMEKLLVLLFLLCLFPMGALAQGTVKGTVIDEAFEDNGELLTQNRLVRAERPVLDRGAHGGVRDDGTGAGPDGDLAAVDGDDAVRAVEDGAPYAERAVVVLDVAVRRIFPLTVFGSASTNST